MKKNHTHTKLILKFNSLISIFKLKSDKLFTNKLFESKTAIIKKQLEFIDQKKLNLTAKVKPIISKIKSNTKNLNPVNLFESGQEFIEKKVLVIDQKKVELRPSRRWAQAIILSLVSGVTFGIGWLALAKTEEVVIAQGKLEPLSKVIDIQIPVQGITKEIFVEEGERVVKGQLLLMLDTEVTEAEQKALTKNYQTQQNILSDLKTLLEEGAISRLQYYAKENEINDLETKIIKNKVTLKYQKIVSPINGLVFDLQRQQAGYVANRTDPIMKIVPTDDLIARVEVSSQKIGFVELGKNVDISIDSFPSSDFGVITGVVTKISSDALPPDPRFNKGYRYPTDIKLNEQFLISNKNKLPLQAGMSLTANIKLRKVSYLDLLLTTFKDKTDSLKSL